VYWAKYVDGSVPKTSSTETSVSSQVSNSVEVTKDENKRNQPTVAGMDKLAQASWTFFGIVKARFISQNGQGRQRVVVRLHH
jgi:hypothetical protein